MNDIYSVRGRIFDIQKFSVHDGPGIRTIVFLKGCSLRCRWCCNPESQEFDIQEMKTGNISKTVGKDTTVGEIIEEVLKDRIYYRRSGGGLTLSGGECLLQANFSQALLAAAKENGINTAIETAGNVHFEDAEKILPYLDIMLMDIKHINSDKHKEFTGSSNERILENAVKFSKTVKKLIVRVPVVPGFNDTDEEIMQIADFASKLENVDELHLLPYHRLGADKYDRLGRKYTLSEILPPSDEKMEHLKEVVLKTGLKCQIGG